MEYPGVSVTILAYRSKETIRPCVDSVLQQDYRGEIIVRVREQAGDDEEYTILENIAQKAHERRRIFISRGENLGFAAGHNALIRESENDFVLCLNADAVLAQDFLSRAIPFFADPTVGAVQGKLLRWDAQNGAELRGPHQRALIDTTGLKPLKNRRIVNRGQGEEDRGQYDTVAPRQARDAEAGDRADGAGQLREEIFGADGASPLYRKAALEDVAIPYSAFKKEVLRQAQDDRFRNRDNVAGEIFDEDFFIYKEDVDLAWRFQWRGWRTLYVPEAVAWHGRGSGDSAAHTPLKIIGERRKISPHAKYYSFTNQRLLQIKNEALGALARDFFPWILKEFGAWSVAILTESKTIPAIIRLIRLTPVARKKRRWIIDHRKTNANPYRWFRQ